MTMSVSPLVHNIVATTHDSSLNAFVAPSSSSVASHVQLSSLLADSYRELDSLRLDLSNTRKRAEKAERQLQSFTLLADSNSTNPNGSPQNIPESTAHLVMALEERATRAEQALEDSDSRRRQLADSWKQLDHYLAAVEYRAQDARAAFARIIAEGVGQLVLGSIPPPASTVPTSAPSSTPSMAPPSVPSRLQSASSRHASSRTNPTPSFPSLPLPPPPNPNPNPGVRRPRTPSMDSYPGIQPRSKRSRGNSDEQRGTDSYADLPSTQQHLHPNLSVDARDRDHLRQHPGHNARLIMTPADRKLSSPRRHSRSHSRSSSRSSASSLDVDEMLLRATTGDENGVPNGFPPSPTTQSQHLTVPHNTHRPLRQRDPDDASRTQSNQAQGHPHIQGQGAHQAVFPPTQQGQLSRSQQESPPYPVSQPSRADGAVPGPLPQPGQLQTYQTHVFAPVVTGAPTKKSKFNNIGTLTSQGSISSLGPIDAPPAPAPPVTSFPPTNEHGQRICRQCGLAGRYKDGKCVEKWGPGPMGPGTVCDRCRKKMKRVERRGTLENQQQLASASSLGSLPVQQHQPRPSSSHAQSALAQGSGRTIQRSDTIITHQSQGGGGSTQHSFSQPDRRERERERERERGHEREAMMSANQSNVRTVITVPGKTRTPPSPPPDIAILREHESELPLSNIGRGASAAASRAHSRNHSRSNSRNGRPTATGRGNRPTPPVGSEGLNGIAMKRSPLGSISGTPGGVRAGSQRGTISPTQMELDETDADAEADGEAEAEAEAEIIGAVEAAAGGDIDMDRPSHNGEEDAELLEAVEAAAANSNGSHSGGDDSWLKSEDI